MSPLELFHEARLAEAIAAQTALVAAKPKDLDAQLLLCEFLAYAGDRKRVRQQLKAIRTKDTALQDYLDGWRHILHADSARHSNQEAHFLIEPPEHILRRTEIPTLLANGDEEQAIDILDSLDESGAWLTGHVDGREFDGLRDADDLLSPVLEIFHADEYIWVPWEQIRKLRLAEPENLRDQLYRPAQLWLTDRTEWDVIVPTLYTSSSTSEEEGVQIGAGTDWVESGPFMRGVGGKTILFGEEELMLSEFTQVEVKQ
jgi:type VI secretion system protein ImpE